MLVKARKRFTEERQPIYSESSNLEEEALVVAEPVGRLLDNPYLVVGAFYETDSAASDNGPARWPSAP